MKAKRLIEILGEPSKQNDNWSRKLTDRDVERLNRDIKIYQLMIKRRSPHLNIYGLHVHLGTSFNPRHIENYEDYIAYAKNEILPYLTDIIETCKSILKIGWLPNGTKYNGSGVLYDNVYYGVKHITMFVAYNYKDVRRKLPKYNGAPGILGSLKRFDCRYCVSCEQYKDADKDLDRFFEYIDDAFKQHTVDSLKIKDIEKYQRRYWFNYDNEMTQKLGLKNAEFIDGNLKTRNTMFLSVKNGWIKAKLMELTGDAKNITGNAEFIYGKIPEFLYGDVSSLSGDITFVCGDATGVELNIDLYRRRAMIKRDAVINLDEMKSCKVPALSNKYKTLTYKENAILMKAWRTFCYHTIGLPSDVYDKFDNPVKVKPPFPVDKWGRYYEELGDTMRIYSVNPADIMFAKDVNKCSTCFCLNSGHERWKLGMRCLIAEATVNPNLGVVLEFRKKDMTKKLNQFKGVKFRWFDPDEAKLFQYTSKHARCFCFSNNNNLLPCFDGNIARKDIVPIWGHDGICDDQYKHQEKFAYLETFIKPEYAWYDGTNKEFPLVNNYENFYESDISDEWKEQIKRANNMADELRALIGTDKGDK